MKLSIFGSSEIIQHHIKAAKKNSFKIFGIFTSNPKSTNVKKLSKKFQIKKIYYSWQSLLNDSKENGCSVLIAGRLKDNEKILEYAVKKNIKILIEKPIFTSSIKFNRFIKYKKNIFVGYNRIFYNGIYKIKKIILKNKPHNLILKCPEISKKNILLNTCHLISIIYYFFGKIKLVKKIKNKNSIFCIFKSKQNTIIIINISFNSVDNFSFELNFEKLRVKQEPIEKLTIYNKLNKINYRDTTIYKPKTSLILDEYSSNNLKPGFDNQYKSFKKFIKNKKTTYINLSDAKNIVSICEKIIN